HVEGGAAENITERTEKPENKKAKQCKNVDRASRKRKSQTKEKQEVKKQKTTLQSDNQRVPRRLPHIPLESLMDTEMRLVCIDEDNISFEFPYSVVSSSTHTQPAHGDSERTGAPRKPHGSALSRVDKQLKMTLREASNYYRKKKYSEAVELLKTALELCSKGNAIGNPFESSPEDISSIASFIETKLAICYLKLKKPDEALNHAHRSIILNPSYFRNHLRQAAAFRCLRRYSEAARSAMIADYMYWLTEGAEYRTRKLIRQYWQAMLEEAIMGEVSFLVLYTPFMREVKANKINKIEGVFAKMHPDYVQHIYTDPHGHHILPQTTAHQLQPPQKYALTLGFRNKPIGKIMERWSNKKLPIFSERKAPFCHLTKEDAERYWNNIGKKIVPVMDFIRSTKLTDDRCPCARGIEKLHYASLLGCLQRVEEQSQVINQAMAELATLPYLQDISQQDAKLV
ncbi:SPT16 protein, partial [Halcyon senegalensis]|nr:SPT16 protein [Halcyon senegalensis]